MSIILKCFNIDLNINALKFFLLINVTFLIPIEGYLLNEMVLFSIFYFLQDFLKTNTCRNKHKKNIKLAQPISTHSFIQVKH